MLQFFHLNVLFIIDMGKKDVGHHPFSIIPQGKCKCSLQFWKCVVKESCEVIHLNFQTLDYSCQRFESMHACRVATICCQVDCSQNDDNFQKVTYVLWFDKTKWVKWVMDTVKQNMEWIHLSCPFRHLKIVSQVVCVRGKFPFLQCTDGPIWCV